MKRSNTMKRSKLIYPLVLIPALLFLFSSSRAAPTFQLSQVKSVLDQYQGDESTWPHQVTDRWCWAATAQIIMSSFGQTAWRQCIQADDAFPYKSNPRTCCDDPEHVLCNRTNWPSFEYYGFQSALGTLVWDQLKSQIDSNQPVAVTVGFKGRSGLHMGVVAGYAETEAGEQLVFIVDPDGFHSGVWNQFEEIWGDASEIWSHEIDFYDIRPVP